MGTEPSPSRDAVVALYTTLLEAWNARDAGAFADHFTGSGSSVGFDGSQMDGRGSIRTELERIFADHTPATYVAKVREVRALGPSVTLLRAVAGMVPPGALALKPERNAIQSLVTVIEGGESRVALFHNTPARFDGRPQLAEQLSRELDAVQKRGLVVDAS
jgi:uncharacterized protein (TIGR02246 family)